MDNSIARLIERMNRQIAEWDDEEPRDDWWNYQCDFAQAATTLRHQAERLEEVEAVLRKFAGDDWPSWVEEISARSTLSDNSQNGREG